MRSSAFAHPLEEYNADVEERIELSQKELPDDCSASLVYAGYPYDPYA
jgi:hypothetical protein